MTMSLNANYELILLKGKVGVDLYCEQPLLAICLCSPILGNTVSLLPLISGPWPVVIRSQHIYFEIKISHATKYDKWIWGSCPSRISPYDEFPDGMIICVLSELQSSNRFQLKFTSFAVAIGISIFRFDSLAKNGRRAFYRTVPKFQIFKKRITPAMMILCNFSSNKASSRRR